MNLKDMKQIEQHPLPETKTMNGMLYRLDPQTQTYHLEIDRAPLSRYGELLRRQLQESNPVKEGALMVENRYWTFLEEHGERLETMYEKLMDQMKQDSKEPVNYNQRVEWLNQMHQTAHELILQEINSLIL